MKNLFFLTVLLLTGCGETGFKKVEQLDGFRILAIEASQPEVAPNTAVNLRLFVSDPTGPTSGRIIVGELVTCIDPGISVGAPVSCDHDPGKITAPVTIDTQIADFQNNFLSGYTAPTSVTVPANILTGRSTREQINGVAYLAIFTFEVDGQLITAFKRIIATTRTPLNTNPTGSAILLNGAAFSGNPKEKDKLSMTSSAPESYDYVNVDGSVETKVEKLEVAWFVPEGEFDKPKADLSEEVELTKSPPAASYVLIGILRDDRGGVEVVRIKIP
jgi:hypothetical protein